MPFPLPVDGIAALPEVEEAINTPYAFLDRDPGEPVMELSPLYAPDYRTVKHHRSKLLEGRRADPDRADEATVNPVAVRGGAPVGSTLRLQAWTPDAAPGVARR